MKAKALRSSPAGQALEALRQRITEVNQGCKDFAKSKGWTEWISSSWNVSDSIDGVYFPEKPEGWKVANTQGGQTFYFPKSTKANSALLTELAELPKVRRQEYNKSIGYKAGPFGVFGMVDAGEYFLLDMNEEHAPDPFPEGMEEITVSEYRSLKAATEEAKQTEEGGTRG